jgi:hypothetical protein
MNICVFTACTAQSALCLPAQELQSCVQLYKNTYTVQQIHIFECQNEMSVHKSNASPHTSAF